MMMISAIPVDAADARNSGAIQSLSLHTGSLVAVKSAPV